MQFTFAPLTAADAREIMSWRYEEPYAVYNMTGDDEEAGLLDQRSPYFGARDEHGALVGYFAFGTAAEVEDYPAPALYRDDEIRRRGVLSLGLGLRPDLTGHSKGLGLAFVSAGLDFARERFHPRAFRLYVLAFNERAMRVYERAGFQRVRTMHVHNMYGERDFMEMWREA